MRKVLQAALIILTVVHCSFAIERVAFNAGISRQNPGGAVELQSGYSFYIGGGAELVDDLTAVLKFSVPAKYAGVNYPMIVNINEVKETLNYREFTMFDLELTGHYTFPVFEGSKINPKIFGGLGIHWLYNSVNKAGEPNVEFRGIGPEFGLGAVYRPADNLQFDFTASVKFPYYNEYDKENAQKIAVGLDQQVICFNFSLYYLLRF